MHIPKTAGQSIEHVFVNMLGLRWEARAPLLLMPNDLPELGPPRLAHLKAAEYVRFKYLTQEMFDDYFKFSFVRNPWSRLVSIYKFLGYEKKIDFRSFLLGMFKNHLFERNNWFVGPQSDFVYSKNGELLVDYLGRFEDLQNGFEFVCKQVGIPVTRLPHVNKSKSNYPMLDLSDKQKCKSIYEKAEANNFPDSKNYQDYYDEDTIDCVAQLYRKDIMLFGYDFE